MRVVLQRVRSAAVTIDGQAVGAIQQGFMLLVAAQDSDGDAEVDYLVRKISKLRVFSDADGKMNLSIQDVHGSILSVSQFTLYADTRKGNRPGFGDAGEPTHAKTIYEQFNAKLAALGIPVETGEFGADMLVQLKNDGPVTIIFDTDQK